MKNRDRKKTKRFDAVKAMRTIRDGVSREIRDMSFEEEKAYLKKLLTKQSTATK